VAIPIFLSSARISRNIGTFEKTSACINLPDSHIFLLPFILKKCQGIIIFLNGETTCEALSQLCWRFGDFPNSVEMVKKKSPRRGFSL
jgi:hypothetical protein